MGTLTTHLSGSWIWAAEYMVIIYVQVIAVWEPLLEHYVFLNCTVFVSSCIDYGVYSVVGRKGTYMYSVIPWGVGGGSTCN